MNKADFPIFKTFPELCYLDNAATSQKPQQVITAISDFYTSANANVHRGIYALSETATQEYEAARATVAKFINAETAEVIFNSGTTAGINMLAEYYFAPKLKTDDVILVSDMEHHSNLIPWQQLLKKTGIKLAFLPLTSQFTLNLNGLKEMLQKQPVKVVSLTFVSNVLGTINPIKDICTLIKAVSPQTLIVVDAAQEVPHLKLDVKDLGCDFLVFSGHKMLGPTGIGVLWGKQKLLEQSEPWFTGGGMIESVNRENSTWTSSPEKFEAGTPNIEGAIGLAHAIDYLEKISLQKIKTYEGKLIRLMLTKLLEIPELTLYGPADINDISNRGAVFSFNLKGIHAHDLAQLLDYDQIAVRAGHHCCQILHREVLGIPASVRASLYFYNDDEDIEKLYLSLKKIAAKKLN
jgi:cysteine desulfurase / selenocysteine lyase